MDFQTKVQLNSIITCLPYGGGFTANNNSPEEVDVRQVAYRKIHAVTSIE